MSGSYDEKNGPAGPYCFGPCLYGEWDDPTFVTVTVDVEYMIAETDYAVDRGYASTSLRYDPRDERQWARIMRLLDEDDEEDD